MWMCACSLRAWPEHDVEAPRIHVVNDSAPATRRRGGKGFMGFDMYQPITSSPGSRHDRLPWTNEFSLVAAHAG